MTDIYHIPVLFEESINALEIQPSSVCVDLTFGGGGHSRGILDKLDSKGHLYSFDQDIDAIKNIKEDSRFTFVRSNFRYLKNFMRYYGVKSVNAILADLGVSSHHFDAEERGFSFRFEDSDLDMRMNQKGEKTAASILNTYEEAQLADVFYYYGELRQSRALARAVMKARENGTYKTAGDFLATAESFNMRGEKKNRFLAQVFQALRIEVNDEMTVLKEALLQSMEMLEQGGRMAVITYHSLEDRLVKNFFRTGNFEGKLEKDFYGNILSPFKLINNRVIVPSKEELEKNPRSRSAKLRIVEKI